MLKLLKRPIVIGSRVCLGGRVGIVMAISATLARVEWNDEDWDIVLLSLLVADKVKTGKGITP